MFPFEDTLFIEESLEIVCSNIAPCIYLIVFYIYT